MEEKTSMDLTVVIIMPYQLESFLKLHVIMSAVNYSSVSCWERETGCLSQCLRAVLFPLCCSDSTPLIQKLLPTKCYNRFMFLIFVSFLSVSFN